MSAVFCDTRGTRQRLPGKSSGCVNVDTRCRCGSAFVKGCSPKMHQGMLISTAFCPICGSHRGVLVANEQSIDLW